ncbi:MAG: sugar phosphate nucleotidyltransferase, partial [Planctomycetota bacterium]
MQVVILCGGRGTRIRGEVSVPKPMVPIGGFPILWHIMKTYSHFGHKDFILCLGYKGWEIKQFFMNYQAFTNDVTVHFGERSRVEFAELRNEVGWKVTLAETGLNAMTGARVKRIEKYITGDEFMLTYGDGVGDIDLDGLVRFHRQHGKIATLTGVEPPGRFGDLRMKGDQVTEFIEKPQISGTLINGGYFVLNRRVFDYIEDREDQMF